MAKHQHELCVRCQAVYNSAQSDYCTHCLRTHPQWAPNQGCADLGCDLPHHDAADLAAEILAWRTRKGYSNRAHMIAMKLGEETGEVLGALVKAAEGRADRQDLLDEIGDVGICLWALAAALGCDPIEIIERRWRENVSLR